MSFKVVLVCNSNYCLGEDIVLWESEVFTDGLKAYSYAIRERKNHPKKCTLCNCPTELKVVEVQKNIEKLQLSH